MAERKSGDPGAGRVHSGGAPATEQAGSVAHPYVHDDPWHSGAPERLGRRGFGQRIAHTIGTRKDPAGLVLALYGEWGQGKTSVLEMVKEDLSTFDDVVVVDFNPWRFRDAEDLVAMFFRKLAEEIGPKVRLRTGSDTVGKSLRRYGGILNGIPVVGTGFAELAAAVGKRLEDPTLETLRERVETGILAAEVRPVIFIDDVDRLDGEEIRAVVRLVKLTAGFKNVTYVLAFDPEVVSAALAAAVGSSAPQDGRRYLEKIVQVPLQLPAADQMTLWLLMLEHLNEAIGDVAAPFPEIDQQAFVRYCQPLFEARTRTVREGKRYANAVGFALPLLVGEVHTGDLLLLEAIRAWYPAVYARVQWHRELFVGDELGTPPSRARSGDGPGPAEKAWAEVIEGLNATEERAVRQALEHLFPFVEAITKNTHHGVDWIAHWDRGQRVASRNYFDRYFQYAIPRTDVSDRTVADLEARLGLADLAGSIMVLRREGEAGGLNRLIEKVGAEAASLTPTQAETLARAVSATGDLYLDAQGGFFGDLISPQSTAVRIVRVSLKRLPPALRGEFGADLVRGSPSLRFAAATYSWLRAIGSEREEGTAPLTEQDEQQVEAVLRTRLHAEHSHRPLYRWEPARERRMLLEWWGITLGPDHTRADLAARFAHEPRQAAELLLPFRSHGWLLETGLPTANTISANSYKAIARLADPQMIVDALHRVFGQELGTHGEYETPEFTTEEESAADQFALQHRLAVARAERAEVASGQQDNATEGA